MKVLFDHPSPFALAHGGFQTQIEQTKAALEKRGIEVEFLRWWDDRQRGDIIHYFGRPTGDYIGYAHAKGIKVIIAPLLTGLGSRSTGARLLQKGLMTAIRLFFSKTIAWRLSWDVYQKADAFVALTGWEAHLMQTMFGADPSRVCVVPNGVETIFFDSPLMAEKKPRADYLVCTATIHPRKRVLELAEAAVRAHVPVRIIGKPYSESDPYYLRFLEVQKKHPELIHYKGGIFDRAELAGIYREARGFVLLSSMESLSLSALEAAAAQCPLLLSDLPWAGSVFGSDAAYASVSLREESLARILLDFSRNAPSMQAKFKPSTWDEVASLLQSLYTKLVPTPGSSI